MALSRREELENRIAELHLQLQDAEEELRAERKVQSEKRELDRQANWIAQRNKERVFRPGDTVQIRDYEGREYIARIRIIKQHREKPDLDWCAVLPVEGTKSEIAVSFREIVKILSNDRRAPHDMFGQKTEF